MFEKQSHVHTSVSWGGFGAVWEQTPRQTKETDSSFATTCTLAEQAGPHQNRRPLQIFIISPLLTSLLIFPWNKRNHKSSFFFFPLSFHSFKSLGRDQNLLRSDIIRPRELASSIPVQQLGHLLPTLRSHAFPLPLPTSLECSHPFWGWAIVFSCFSPKG